VPNGTDAFPAASHTFQALSPSSRREERSADAEMLSELGGHFAFQWSSQMEYWMTSWLWLLPPFIGFAIFVFRDARGRETDLGSVSEQWLHEYRQTEQNR
jgi:hypothetical protein